MDKNRVRKNIAGLVNSLVEYDDCDTLDRCHLINVATSAFMDRGASRESVELGLKEFIDGGYHDPTRLFGLIEQAKSSSDRCVKCRTHVKDGMPYGPYVDGKVICNDCYFFPGSEKYRLNERSELE